MINNLTYDQTTMLRMVDKDEVLRHLAKDKAKELTKERGDNSDDQGTRGFMQDWFDALEWVFNQRIKNDATPNKYYHRAWLEAMPKARDFVAPPEPTNGITRHILSEIQKIVNGFGWDKLIKSLSEYSRIKSVEMFNSGFDDHSKNWEKIANELRKLSKKHVMT